MKGKLFLIFMIYQRYFVYILKFVATISNIFGLEPKSIRFKVSSFDVKFTINFLTRYSE